MFYHLHFATVVVIVLSVVVMLMGVVVGQQVIWELVRIEAEAFGLLGPGDDRLLQNIRVELE